MLKKKKEKIKASDTYCYKLKKGVAVIEKMRQLGFCPMYETIEGEEEELKPVGGIAKPILLSYKSDFALWVRRNLENIYKLEIKKEEKELKPSEWLQVVAEDGIEFDEEGHLIENDAVKKPIEAQLCVMFENAHKNVLFINVSGAIELVDARTLDDCCPEEIQALLNEDIIYKKKFL